MSHPDDELDSGTRQRLDAELENHRIALETASTSEQVAEACKRYNDRVTAIIDAARRPDDRPR